jgi:hypothetical protein
MATPTYEPIQTQILVSATSTVTFNSIPQTYTDLILVINGTGGSLQNIHWQANGDTNSNYSHHRMFGDGSSAIAAADNIYAAFAIFGTSQSTAILQLQNYSKTNTFKSALGRGSANGYVSAYISLWRSNAAINTLAVKSVTTNFAVGTTFALYGIQPTDSSSSTPKASGGTITTDMLYTYHTFTAGGTFTPSQDLTADVLIVGGGGGSGDANAGGGGAGGVIYAPARSFTNATTYTAVIGAGGGANAGGVASTFSGLSATGGGYSIGEGSSGTNGGSGGGGGGGGGTGTFTAGISTGSSGADYTFYGNSGGLGRGGYNSGGGGGAGAVGSPARGQDNGSGAGDGGVGLQTWSSWLTATNTGHNVSGVRYIGGGGGGGANTGPVGIGGFGGGGTGKSDSSTGTQTPGTANTGGGAGGTGGVSSRNGTNGGSGLIIIRYPKA